MMKMYNYITMRTILHIYFIYFIYCIDCCKKGRCSNKGNKPQTCRR